MIPAITYQSWHLIHSLWSLQSLINHGISFIPMIPAITYQSWHLIHTYDPCHHLSIMASHSCLWSLPSLINHGISYVPTAVHAITYQSNPGISHVPAMFPAVHCWPVVPFVDAGGAVAGGCQLEEGSWRRGRGPGVHPPGGWGWIHRASLAPTLPQRSPAAWLRGVPCREHQGAGASADCSLAKRSPGGESRHYKWQQVGPSDNDVEYQLKNDPSSNDMNCIRYRLQNDPSSNDMNCIRYRLQNVLSSNDMNCIRYRLQNDPSSNDMNCIRYRLQNDTSSNDMNCTGYRLHNDPSGNDMDCIGYRLHNDPSGNDMSCISALDTDCIMTPLVMTWTVLDTDCIMTLQ